MTRTNLHQSNTAALPPPSPALSPTAEVPRLPRPAQFSHSSDNRQNHRPPRRPISKREPFIRWRVPENPGVCLSDSLRERWRNYSKQLRACRDDFSESHIHQLRVASRRLMTAFLLVSSGNSGDQAEKARVKLKRRLKVLGALRDTHVQKNSIEKELARFPEIKPLHAFLRRRERKWEREATRVLELKTQKLEKWMRGCCRELAASDDSRDTDALGRQVRRSLTFAYAELNTRRELIDPANSQTIHKTRVAFKRFRYMVEALSPVFTGVSKGQLRRLGDYQRRMGNLQDAEVLQGLVTAFLQRRPQHAASFKAFSRCLAAKRAWALQSCLKHADDILAFSPLSAMELNARLERNAA